MCIRDRLRASIIKLPRKLHTNNDSLLVWDRPLDLAEITQRFSEGIFTNFCHRQLPWSCNLGSRRNVCRAFENHLYLGTQLYGKPHTNNDSFLVWVRSLDHVEITHRLSEGIFTNFVHRQPPWPRNLWLTQNRFWSLRKPPLS